MTEQARTWLRGAPADIMISSLVGSEFASAVARKHRMRLLTRDEAEQAFAAFDAWERRAYYSAEVTSADFTLAATWLRRLDLTLRAPDAVHLAVVRRVGAFLATFDAGMATAARTLGIPVAEA